MRFVLCRKAGTDFFQQWDIPALQMQGFPDFLNMDGNNFLNNPDSGGIHVFSPWYVINPLYALRKSSTISSKWMGSSSNSLQSVTKWLSR